MRSGERSLRKKVNSSEEESRVDAFFLCIARTHSGGVVPLRPAPPRRVAAYRINMALAGSPMMQASPRTSMAGEAIEQLKEIAARMRAEVPIRDRSYHLRLYKNAFIASVSK